MTETTDQDITVHDAPEKHRYEIHVGEVRAGFAQYRLPDEGHVDFVHTEIDDAFSGQGLASRLVSAALADVRTRGKRIIPHCPYVAGWIKRHPEYDDITDWPQPRQ
ncbi:MULTISPECIES: GNAT family N-acetyltransferase [unclassified Nocardioides]|uniref:GNAT family N-acetyltransferase n=1 Tax=unclassified Nocardioides TaxID=2615069 RepID=UPI0006F9BEB7|nr:MULTISPECIES: GNAT family N-acetyltransferase [unclassified Nocardioides]KQY56788.1 acetyltransferase [Nocardioides sp. Root140]KQZ67016.1 acetyltransferase [Nocardioides sp. Root151]KRF12908.1 acetyltransferase [Nocardioides sp. Soil796]